MGIIKEVWVSDIAPKLFPDNSFLSKAIDDSSLAVAGIVHLNESGDVPNVVRNRTVFPAVITEDPDAEHNYALANFTSDPKRIRNLEELEVSYNKRQNTLRNHTGQLQKKIANYILTNWAVDGIANQIIPTTGANRISYAPGATGNRKALTKADLLKVKALFDLYEIPQDGRFLILDAGMYNDLLADTQLLSKDFVRMPSLELGTLGNIYGFQLYARSTVGRYGTGSLVPKDSDAANAATDNAFCLAWHADFVRRALGDVMVYANEDRAEHYGSIFSTEANAGGKKVYSSQMGVVSLVEAV